MATSKKYQIVVCDNQPIVVNGLKALFKKTKDCVLLGSAANGEDLRSLLSQVDANILILDLKIPNTNVYRLIKDFVVTYPKMKIIIFSEYTMPKLVQDMMEFGAHAYMGKTASTDEILKTIPKVDDGERLISPSAYANNKRTTNEAGSLTVADKDNFTKLSELTEREMDIIILLSRGFTNKEMAVKLNLSIFTIETHRKNVMKKLKLKTGAQLMYFASKQGII